MSERPIIMSMRSIEKIMSSQKTQTRRVIKPQPNSNQPPVVLYSNSWVWGDDNFPLGFSTFRKPLFNVDDILWVKEKWRLESWEWDGIVFIGYADGSTLQFELPEYDNEKWVDWLIRNTDQLLDAYGEREITDPNRLMYSDSNYEIAIPEEGPPFKSPLFLPKWASRIRLKVLHVWPERLQDISNEDILHEGIGGLQTPPTVMRELFSEHWNEINAKRGFPWSSNPWVWVVKFRLESDMTTKFSAQDLIIAE